MFHMVIEGFSFPVGPFSGTQADINRLTGLYENGKFAITGHFWRGYEQWHQLWESKPRFLVGGRKWVYVASGSHEGLVALMQRMIDFDELAKVAT